MRDAHAADGSVDNADALAAVGHRRNRLPQRDAFDRSLTCHAIQESKRFAPYHLPGDAHHLRARHKIRPRMHAIQVKQTGGPEALQYVEMEKPKPKNGGVGGLLVQVAKMRGARVFGTVSTPEKANIAREAGADEVINYKENDFETETLRLTNGSGVNVVYDSVGKTTFDKSLNCVARRGVLALFGQSSGPVPPFDPARLAKNGIYLTRPSLAHYTAQRDELLWRAREVPTWIAERRLRLRIDREIRP